MAEETGDRWGTATKEERMGSASASILFPSWFSKILYLMIDQFLFSKTTIRIAHKRKEGE